MLDIPQLIRPREFTLNRNSMQARGLVAWYPLDYQAGFVREMVGGRTGTLAGTTLPSWTTDGEFGNVLDFPGSGGGRITLGDVGDVTSLSLSAWVKFDAIDANWHSIGTKRDGSGNATNWAFRKGTAATSADDELEFYHYNGAFKIWMTTNANLVAGIWYHLVVAYDGASNPKVYKDGVLLTGDWITGFVGPAALVTNNHDAAIGALNDGAEPLNGKLFDFRIHDRMLTPAEVWQEWAHQTRWELYQPVKRRARVFVSAVQTLSPDFITSGAVVFNPTLSPGVVELSPDFIASTAQSFNPEIIHAPQDIELTFIATGAQVFDPTLVPGAMELNPGFISSASQSFNTDLQYGQNVEPGLITSGAQTFNVEIHTEQDLEPGFIATGTVVFNPTLEVGALSILPGFIASTAQAFNVEPSQGAAQYVIEATVDNDAGTVTVEIFNFNTSVTNQLRRWYTDEGPGSAIMIRLAVAEDGTFVDCNVQSHREVNYQGIESGSGLVSATVTATQELAQLFVHQVTRHVTTTNAVIGPVSLISPRPQIDGHARETGAFRLAEDSQVTHVPSEIDRRVFRQLVHILANERSKIWDLLDIVEARGTVCVRTPGLGGEPGIIIFGTMRRWPPSEDGFISDYQIEVEQTSFKEAIS